MHFYILFSLGIYILQQIKIKFNCTKYEKGVPSEYYDLILLDDMMPVMSGKQTFAKLKENPDFKTPVVVLTANAVSGMKEDYLALGFDDYLAKPINKKELDEVLDKYLTKEEK